MAVPKCTVSGHEAAGVDVMAQNALSPDYLVAEMIDRGLAPHVAQAFVMNMRDESGLNAGINEAAPIVPGSRGGFGLSQWTGPRRRALESFAAQRGVNAADPELQLDFLMTELRGPEKAAADAIFAAPDAGTAAAAIVNKFLRPAEEHRARREAAYLGGQSVQTGNPSPPSSNALAGYEPQPISPVAMIEARQQQAPQMQASQARQQPIYDNVMQTNALAGYVPQYDTTPYLSRRLQRG